MSPVTSRVLAMTLLTATYLLALASLDPLDAVVGALASAAIVFGLGRFLFPGAEGGPPGLLGRMLRFPLFAAVIVKEMTVGTWQVALVVLGVHPLVRPGIVAVPVGERSTSGIAATALAITLSPGEVFVDLDRKAGRMYVHVLDARDPDVVRERYERFYRRYQRGVFP